MKKCLLFLLVLSGCFFFTHICQAQEGPIFKWAHKLVSRTCYGGNNTPALTKSDAAGNVYMFGSACDPFDADPGPGTFTLTPDNGGYDDVFLIKLDPNGNFLWAVMFAEPLFFNFPSALVVDANGNVFTTTRYQVGASNFRTIITKFDASGNSLWTNRIVTTKGSAHGMVLDASGNLILTGDFSGTVDFDPGSGIHSVTANGSETDYFVLKLDNDGNFLWVRTAGGVSYERGITIALDGSNNIIVAGYYMGTADLDPSAGISNVTSAGNLDVFILKLDASGNFIWAKSVGGPELDIVTSIAVNTSNNIFLTGYFAGSGDFDPNSGVTTLTSASGYSDIFLMRLNADGSFGWASGFGAADADEGQGLITDASGNIIFTGFFNGTVDFDPGAGVRNLVSIGQNSYHGVFIVKLDEDRQLVWAEDITSTVSTSSQTRGYTISIDAAGDISLGGRVWTNVDFDFGPCERSLGNNPPVSFVMKFKTGDVFGPPTITSFSPTSGTVGTTVVITGTNFSPIASENEVHWSPNQQAQVISSTPTSITAVVPPGASFGKIYVTVSCHPIAISTGNFTVGAAPVPTITSFTPSSGPVGTSVTITGTNFSTTPVSNTVRFNGTVAAVSASTATSITTTVPANATTGKITVTISGNTATSTPNFTVTTPTSLTITSQPVNFPACPGDLATFNTSATGTTNITYRWQREDDGIFADINDGNGYSGTSTSTFSINTSQNNGVGIFRCRINGDGSPQLVTNEVSITLKQNCEGNQPPAIEPSVSAVLAGGTITIDLKDLVSDPDDNLDFVTLYTSTNTDQGALATLDDLSYILTLDYGDIQFTGTDYIAVGICDLEGECIEEQLAIEVGADIEVYNAISPNGDGKNDVLLIQHIDILPDAMKNHVTIFNRWGSKVFDVSNYDNNDRVFKGVSNGGKDLPSGTYYYKIEFAGGRKTQTGYLSLKR